MSVIAKILGGKEQLVENVRFIKDVRGALNVGKEYHASMDGVPVDDEDIPREGSRVTFAPQVNGGF